MRNIVISGCAGSLPDNKIKFKDQTRYRLGGGKTMLDLAEKACAQAIGDAGMTINDIDAIIGAMATPLELLPCNGSLIHEKIAKGTSIPAFDVDTSCTSFLTAMDLASYLICAGRYKNVLIVSGDTASQGLNPDQKESYELFSDACCAFVISRSSDSKCGIIGSDFKTWSEGAHDTEIRGGGALLSAFNLNEYNKADFLFDMKGKRILKLAMSKVPPFIDEFLSQYDISFDDIDVIVPHQASKALDLMMKRLGVSKDKYINRVSEYGNMISASIPFVLCEAIHDGRIRKGDKVLLMGSGAGLTVNLVLLAI